MIDALKSIGVLALCPAIGYVGFLLVKAIVRPIDSLGIVAQRRGLTRINLAGPVKMLICGILAIACGYLFWHCLAGDPLDELALIRRGKIVHGFIVAAREDVEVDEYGRTHSSIEITYKYRLPDGMEFTQYNHDGRLDDELRNLAEPYPVDVEYLPDDPSVSRIKGNGCSSIFEWMWRKVAFGGLLLALVLIPGVILVRDAIRDCRLPRCRKRGRAENVS